MLGTNLFLPVYLIVKVFMAPKSHQLKKTLKESVQSFKDKGFTLGKTIHFFEDGWIKEEAALLRAGKENGAVVVTFFSSQTNELFSSQQLYIEF